VLTDSEGRFSIPDVIASARYQVQVDSNAGSAGQGDVAPGAPLTLQIRAPDATAALAHTSR
jgi:hypothetical protein